MQKLDSPWPLCGDFNTPAESWLDRTCFVVVRPESAQLTYPAHQPVEAIDYFLASPGLYATGKVLEVEDSDHLLVVVLYNCRPPVSYDVPVTWWMAAGIAASTGGAGMPYAGLTARLGWLGYTGKALRRRARV